MYLSTLAYCYARSKINKNPNEYKSLEKYTLDNKNNFIKYDNIIVFYNAIEVSQSRRGQDELKEDMAYWVNLDFMKHYRNFYENKASEYTKSNITSINVEKCSLEDVYRKIASLIDK